MFEILLRGGSQKRHFPFRRSAILAERFYITENEGSCYIKKELCQSKALISMPQTGIEPVRSLTLAGF